MSSVILSSEGPVVHLRLNRPGVRNALNNELIGELLAAFEGVKNKDDVRAVLLSGEGSHFCAGGDLSWLRSASVREDARRFAALLSLIDTFPKPVVARVHGGVFGGGIGLISVCDIVVASSETLFALPEVKLGLIPAVISPFLLARIGAGAARRFSLTGERFDAGRAFQICLVHEVAPAGEVEERVKKIVSEILSSGPKAVAACKELIGKISAGRGGETNPAVTEETIRILDEIRQSTECRERIAAFLAGKTR